MPITHEQLFNESFYPQWMTNKKAIDKWKSECQDIIAHNDFMWKEESKESVKRLSNKYGKNGQPL